MNRQAILRHIHQHKLDPRQKHVIEKGKLVPAKKPNIEVNSVEDITKQEMLVGVETSSTPPIVNDQITDAVTQVTVGVSEVIIEETVEIVEQNESNAKKTRALPVDNNVKKKKTTKK